MHPVYTSSIEPHGRSAFRLAPVQGCCMRIHQLPQPVQLQHEAVSSIVTPSQIFSTVPSTASQPFALQSDERVFQPPSTIPSLGHNTPQSPCVSTILISVSPGSRRLQSIRFEPPNALPFLAPSLSPIVCAVRCSVTCPASNTLIHGLPLFHLHSRPAFKGQRRPSDQIIPRPLALLPSYRALCWNRVDGGVVRVVAYDTYPVANWQAAIHAVSALTTSPRRLARGQPNTTNCSNQRASTTSHRSFPCSVLPERPSTAAPAPAVTTTAIAMSDAVQQAPSDPPQDDKPEPSKDASKQSDAAASTDAKMDTAEDGAQTEPEETLPEEILNASAEEIQTRTRLLENDIKIMRSEQLRLNHEQSKMRERIKENAEKVKQNKVLPYLVGNVVEILDIDPDKDEDAQEEQGAAVDLDAQRKGKCAVIKTSTRQTIFLPLIGLVPAEELKPADLIGVNKDSYLVLDKLPAEYDSRVKAMEVDEKPTETYSEIGGLDKQVEELIEAIVLPMQQEQKFKNLGIRPPKGALMYGPPGTGKTLLARACAAQTNACYLKLAGPSLVQMFIGDGAKLVRDAFELAKEKAPAIIFIDELDAIGTKRFDSDKSGDREVQRTMLELLNQLDGFGSDDRIKVIAATNRIDILDPALLRSGRLDRKIEFPLPNEQARARIMEIHSRKMTVAPNVNYEELAASTDEMNGAQLKAVCVEAGMIALREGAQMVDHEHYVGGIMEVQAKKKNDLFYFG